MTASERYYALCNFVLKVNSTLTTQEVLSYASELEALTRRKRSEAKPAGRKARKATVQVDSEAA